MKDARPPIPPAPEVLDRLRIELNDELLERVRRYACQRVGAKRLADIACFDTDDEAENMAAEAATLTVIGHRTWNPSVPLFEHLCGVVRSVSSDQIAHQHLYRHDAIGRLSLDESHGDDVALDQQLTIHNEDRARRPKAVASFADARDRVMSCLRIACRGDHHVTQLLDAYESGCEDRAEVLDCTGMSPSDYKNARRRLDRAIEALPDNINTEALDALEVSYGF
jgi:hypothetical protein